jgi:hypothetical protein
VDPFAPYGNKNCEVKVAVATDANGVTERTTTATFSVGSQRTPLQFVAMRQA